MPRIEVEFTDGNPPQPTCAVVDMFGRLFIMHNGSIVGCYTDMNWSFLIPGQKLQFYYRAPTPPLDGFASH